MTDSPNELINELMNDKGVCRTTLALPVLLNIIFEVTA